MSDRSITMPDRDARHIYSKPLDQDQTRLLALQPGRGNEPLECHIRLVSALTKTPYDAISYVWGSQTTTEMIRCRTDGHSRQADLPLAQNAAEALRAARLAVSERLVWIDCICISQTSHDEKAAQVAMMDSIFANAATVLVWLGADEGGHAVPALEVAERIHERFGDATRFHARRNENLMVAKALSTKAWQRCYEGLGSVLPLFECDWFWRLWCVQELALAKQVLIHWGSVVLTWDSVLAVAAFVESEAQLHLAHNGGTGVHNVIMLESLRQKLRGEYIRQMPFSRLLSLTRLHGVTEPCDRVFSLLGLDRRLSMDSRGFLDDHYGDRWRNGRSRARRRVFHEAPAIVFYQAPTMPPLVTPDYSQGIDKVYLSTAKALLAREGNLFFLSFVQHDVRIGQSGLPSWVPQWHVNKHRLITQFDLLHDHPVSFFLELAWAKNTTGSETAFRGYDGRIGSSIRFMTAPIIHSGLTDSTVVENDGTLRTQGLLLSRVVKSCPSAASMTETSHQWLQTLRDWYRTVSTWFAQAAQPNGSPDLSSNQLDDMVFKTFYRTLLGGHFRVKAVFLELRKELESFRALLLSDKSVVTNPCPTTRAYVIQICRSRTLYLTDTGQLGIGSQYLQPGDHVCFLAGAAVPLLLRPRSDPEFVHRQRRWVLVGETYVDQLSGASPDLKIPEDFPSLLLERTRYFSPLAAGLQDGGSEEEVVQALVDSAFLRMSNSAMEAGVFNEVYYSDLGEIGVSWHTNVVGGGLFSAMREMESGALNVGTYQRMQFLID